MTREELQQELYRERSHCEDLRSSKKTHEAKRDDYTDTAKKLRGKAADMEGSLDGVLKKVDEKLAYIDSQCRFKSWYREGVQEILHGKDTGAGLSDFYSAAAAADDKAEKEQDAVEDLEKKIRASENRISNLRAQLAACEEEGEA